MIDFIGGVLNFIPFKSAGVLISLTLFVIFLDPPLPKAKILMLFFWASSMIFFPKSLWATFIKSSWELKKNGIKMIFNFSVKASKGPPTYASIFPIFKDSTISASFPKTPAGYNSTFNWPLDFSST